MITGVLFMLISVVTRGWGRVRVVSSSVVIVIFFIVLPILFAVATQQGALQGNVIARSATVFIATGVLALLLIDVPWERLDMHGEPFFTIVLILAIALALYDLYMILHSLLATITTTTPTHLT